MAQRVVSITVPEDLAQDVPVDPAEQREVLRLGLKYWHAMQALDRYRTSGCSLAWAAEQAGVTMIELVPLAFAMGIEPDADPACIDGPLSLHDATEL